jgi:hypothetical protein
MGSTSMTDQDSSATSDTFITSRYAELVENRLCTLSQTTPFNVDGMDILISVYSPTGKFTAESITPEMKTMMTAQNIFRQNQCNKKNTVSCCTYDC